MSTAGTSLGLAIEGLTVTLGDIAVLRDVSLQARAGHVTGLIGPNGAGKTTLLDAVTGFVAIAAGSVSVEGRAVTGLPAYRRVGLRLARTWQSCGLFEDLTVAENLLAAAEAAGQDAAVVREVAATTGLDDVADHLASDLAPSRRRWLALARALVARPHVLLLDEPAAGFDRAERRRLGDLLRDVAASGVAVVVVDHDPAMVWSLCDRVVVLDLGLVIADGTPDAVRVDPRVVSAYLGGAAAHTPTRASDATSASEAAVDVRGLTAGYGGVAVLRDVDLHVAGGEMVALLGANGAGKSTTLRALGGLVPTTAGRAQVVGRPTRDGAVRLARAGVALVTAPHGVFASLSVADNLALAARTRADVATTLDLFPMLARRGADPAGRLSGGEQQLLALARALATRPRLLLIDELSTGLAPRTVEGVLAALTGFARERGMAVLFAEQHAHLALAFADRAYVLARGTVVLTGRSTDLAADPAGLAAAYVGTGTEGDVGP